MLVAQLGSMASFGHMSEWTIVSHLEGGAAGRHCSLPLQLLLCVPFKRAAQTHHVPENTIQPSAGLGSGELTPSSQNGSVRPRVWWWLSILSSSQNATGCNPAIYVIGGSFVDPDDLCGMPFVHRDRP